MNEQQEKICKVCKALNAADAEICHHCGARLVTAKTKQFSKDSPLESDLDDTIPKVEPKLGFFSAYLFSTKEPIEIPIKEKFIIGRLDMFQPAKTVFTPDFDLAHYDAHRLGVSRKHVMVSRQGDQWVIEDLGSQNGTWVNLEMLEPHTPVVLKNKDLLRLGHFLMYVYFIDTEPVQTHSRYVIDLESKSKTTRKATMSFEYIFNQIMPYLQAVIDLQYVVNEMLDRPNSVIDFKVMDFDQKDHDLRINIVGTLDTVQYLEKKIKIWQRSLEQRDTLSDVSLIDGEKDKAIEIQHQDTDDPYLIFTNLFIEEQAPQLPDGDKKKFIRRVSSNLRVVLKSQWNLKVATIDE
jgi:ribosomal protein L40E